MPESYAVTGVTFWRIAAVRVDVMAM